VSTNSPVPKNLRSVLIERIEALPDADLPLVNEVLLHAEKQRLWREISGGADHEMLSGALEHLPELIEEVRAKLSST
jgi:hypothetical protein